MVNQNSDYSDDFFAETRMSFGDHLEDLRIHLLRALYGFLFAFLIGLAIARPVLRFIAAPVETAMARFYEERVQKIIDEIKRGQPPPEIARLTEPVAIELSLPREKLLRLSGVDPAKAPPGPEYETITAFINPLSTSMVLRESMTMITRRPGLSTLSAQEAFMAYLKVAIMCGLVIGSPWIFFQLWLFVAAGLYPHEKRYVNVYGPFSFGLFVGGVFLCEAFVLPKALDALLWFNQWVDLEPDLRFNEWLGFAIFMPVVFGVGFQLPLVMLFLERIGIFEVQQYREKWRIALFAIHVFAAVITPSVDVISLELLAIPMFALYWLGILLCVLNPRANPFDMDTPDPEEMVEV